MSSKKADGWSEIWPKRQGLYWFYGYINNKQVDEFPRLHLVVVEYYSQYFGCVYRTGRRTIHRETGAFGLWKAIDQPDLPNLDIYTDQADRAAKMIRRVKELEFKG